MASREPLRLTRHYSELSEKDTDALIGIVADLIVTHLKKRGESPKAPSAAETQEVHS
jgi:hypothetical protein